MRVLIYLLMVTVFAVNDLVGGTQAQEAKFPGAKAVKITTKGERKFGSVVKIVLSGAGEKRFLDLETGELKTVKPTNSLVTYLAQIEKRGWHLVVEGLHNYHFPLDAWSGQSAKFVGEPAGLAGVPFERTGFYKISEGSPTETVMIPTWGMLQVSRDRKTNGVLVQYKRVVTGR